MALKTTSIRVRLISVMVLIISVLLGGFGAVDYFETKSNLEASMRLQLTAALERMSDSLPGPLWNFDEEQIGKIITAEMSAPFVLGVVISDGEKLLQGVMRDGKDRIIATQSITMDADFSEAKALHHVEDGNSSTIGTVTVHVTRQAIDSALASALYNGILKIAVLDLCIILALAWMLDRIVLVPLRRITEALHNIASGDADLTRRLPPSQSLEFRKVVDNFNTFIERLHSVMLEIRLSAESIAGAASEIADGNADLSSRTEIGASALQQTAASIAEMAGSARQNAANTRLANETAADACTSARQGGSVVAEVVTMMRSINESSRKITEIISVIDGIAFQTNILALNAAVEAARAGQQGRGFAVVAGEVRSLAQRSADAAKQIKSLIDESVSKISISNARVEEAGVTMNEVVDKVGRVTSVISEVMEAIQEQTLGIDQINQAVSQMDNTMQQNAALVEQAAAASAMMQDQTHNLENQVATFRLGTDVAHPRAAVRSIPFGPVEGQTDWPLARPPTGSPGRSSGVSPVRPLSVERPAAVPELA